MNPRDSTGKTASIRAKLKFATRRMFVEKYAPNVSRAGIFIKTPSPRPVGVAVKFEFQLANGTVVLRGLGEVAWSRPTPEGDKPEGMGIRFIELDSESQAVVDEILAFKAKMGGVTLPSRYSEGPRIPVDGFPSDEIPSHEIFSPPELDSDETEGSDEGWAAQPIASTVPQADIPRGLERISKSPSMAPPRASSAVGPRISEATGDLLRPRRASRSKKPTINLDEVDSLLAEIAQTAEPPKRPARRRRTGIDHAEPEIRRSSIPSAARAAPRLEPAPHVESPPTPERAPKPERHSVSGRVLAPRSAPEPKREAEVDDDEPQGLLVEATLNTKPLPTSTPIPDDFDEPTSVEPMQVDADTTQSRPFEDEVSHVPLSLSGDSMNGDLPTRESEAPQPVTDSEEQDGEIEDADPTLLEEPAFPPVAVPVPRAPVEPRKSKSTLEFVSFLPVKAASKEIEPEVQHFTPAEQPLATMENEDSGRFAEQRADAGADADALNGSLPPLFDDDIGELFEETPLDIGPQNDVPLFEISSPTRSLKVTADSASRDHIDQILDNIAKDSLQPFVQAEPLLDNEEVDDALEDIFTGANEDDIAQEGAREIVSGEFEESSLDLAGYEVAEPEANDKSVEVFGTAAPDELPADAVPPGLVRKRPARAVAVPPPPPPDATGKTGREPTAKKILPPSSEIYEMSMPNDFGDKPRKGFFKKLFGG